MLANKHVAMALVKQLTAIRDQADAAIANLNLLLSLILDEDDSDSEIPKLPPVFGGKVGKQTVKDKE